MSKRLFVALPLPEPIQTAIYRKLGDWDGLHAPFLTFQRGVMMHATIVPPFDSTTENASATLSKALQGQGPTTARLASFSFRLPTDSRAHATLRVMIEANAELSALGGRY